MTNYTCSEIFFNEVDKMETKGTLGETIRKVRIARHLTLRDVGQAVGTPYQNVQKWETNKSVPNTTQLVALAKVLAVRVDELLTEGFVVGDISGILPANAIRTTLLPFITVVNQAHLLNTFKDYDSVKALNETFPVAISQPINGSSVIIEIGTDIMEPKLMAGSKVFAEAIDTEDFGSEHGGIYAVMYGRNFVIRRIVNNEIVVNGKLHLTADNSKYAPIVVDAESIRAMWKILRVVDAPVF